MEFYRQAEKKVWICSGATPDGVWRIAVLSFSEER
jgi:hypothetical protein